MTRPNAGTGRGVTRTPRLGSVAVALAALLSLAACREQPAKVAAPPEKVTIAHFRFPHSALVHIAATQGFFAAEGLEVTEQFHEFGRLALQSVLEGRADLATPVDTPVMFAIEGGKPVAIVATIARSRGEVGIAARKDRGINRPSDLRGKRIGVPQGSSAHYFLASILSLAGVKEQEVRFVDLKPGALAAALRAGEVDAVAVWQPLLWEVARELGGNGALFTDPDLYSNLNCLVGLREFVRNRPETVKKVLRALLRAEGFLREHPEEGQGIVAAAIRAEPAAFGEIWRLFEFRLALDQGLLISLEDQSLWARRNRLAGSGTPPDYLGHIAFDGLLAVKPGAVQIVR